MHEFTQTMTRIYCPRLTGSRMTPVRNVLPIIKSWLKFYHILPRSCIRHSFETFFSLGVWDMLSLGSLLISLITPSPSLLLVSLNHLNLLFVEFSGTEYLGHFFSSLPTFIPLVNSAIPVSFKLSRFGLFLNVYC